MLFAVALLPRAADWHWHRCSSLHPGRRQPLTDHSGYMITLMELVSQNKRRKACILGLSWVLLTCFEALAQKAAVGRIVGHIDGISQDGDHYFLLGWTCQQGQSKSINVPLFGTQTTNGVSKEGPLFAETANLFSQAGVGEVCRDPQDPLKGVENNGLLTAIVN